jgi:hypothetical protein
MMEMYYWQHEDTGRLTATDFNYPPSHRWYAVSKEFYDMAEATGSAVCNHLDTYIDLLGDKWCGSCDSFLGNIDV